MPYEPPSDPVWKRLVATQPKYAELERVLTEEMSAADTRRILWRLYEEDGFNCGDTMSGIIDWFMHQIEKPEHEPKPEPREMGDSMI